MTETDLLPDAVVRYGEHDLAVVDLHLPDRPAGTLLVLVHGGFWKERYDRTHTRAQARALADLGYLVATPEYRRVGGGGGWPRTADDVEAAVNALPDLLAGLGLTWTRVVLVGHSAGGHLTLWLAGRDLALRVDRVVSVAGVCDLVAARSLGLGSGAVDAFLDGAPIADADPMTLLSTRPGCEVVLVHGDQDDPVPVSLSRGFVAAHPWARLVELPGVGHFEFLDPDDPAWGDLLAAVQEDGPR